MLNIKKELNGSALKVALEGRLDTSTSPQLEEEMKNALNGVTELVFDMEGLEYISSAGLRVLLSVQKVMNQQGSMQLLEAEAPQAEMFKYATDLRSMTQARGSFSMRFERYEEVPANEAQKIIANAKIEDDDEE